MKRLVIAAGVLTFMIAYSAIILAVKDLHDDLSTEFQRCQENVMRQDMVRPEEMHYTIRRWEVITH